MTTLAESENAIMYLTHTVNRALAQSYTLPLEPLRERDDIPYYLLTNRPERMSPAVLVDFSEREDDEDVFMDRVVEDFAHDRYTSVLYVHWTPTHAHARVCGRNGVWTFTRVASSPQDLELTIARWVSSGMFESNATGSRVRYVVEEGAVTVTDDFPFAVRRIDPFAVDDTDPSPVASFGPTPTPP